MGRDKAEVHWNGLVLWQKQLATLKRLEPGELVISGKPAGPYFGSAEIVPDLTPGRGPLSGLEAVLSRATHPFVVVLAIDLPAMTTEFLAGLVGSAIAAGKGVIPCIDGSFEPLAAVYRRDSLELVRRRLAGEDFSMQSFVREAVEQGLAVGRDVASGDVTLFRNVNAPQDLE